MNVWEQLWYFKSIAKTSQVSQITHLPAIACCSGIFVSLQSCKNSFRFPHFVSSFKTCWTEVTADYFNTETLAQLLEFKWWNWKL